MNPCTFQLELEHNLVPEDLDAFSKRFDGLSFHIQGKSRRHFLYCMPVLIVAGHEWFIFPYRDYVDPRGNPMNLVKPKAREYPSDYAEFE